MKIFLTTMSMGIGGAETHIYELALMLIKRGYDVTIVSAGGEYMPKLVERGVKHIYAPMNVRSVGDILKSYKILCSAIKSEKPCLIHAHARIPALVSYYAAKKFNIPFVTTDHGKFDTSFLTTLMTRWGDKTIAVSEDLKKYLLDNYKIKKENVFLTINGIDTDAFTPEKPKNLSLAAEFDIPQDAKVILTVSRLDDTAFRCAEELIDCAETIHKSDPNTRIVIVGGGNLYDDIKQRADKVNASIGFEYVKMTGRRTDISEFCSIGDIFCGVSRAAMEAASSGKPVLLAGDGAYFGMLNKDNLKEAESYNFTCRGVNGFDKKKFVDDILYALSGRDDVKQTTAFLRDYVINNLSAQRMADDTEKVYFEALREKGKYHCVLLGYYGFGNLGDDTLLISIINNLRRKIPYLRVAVLSHNVKSMRRKLQEQKADVYNRFNPFYIHKVFKQSDFLIFGGGTLLQDNTSTKSLLYYLYMIKGAKKNGLDVVLYANGIGPIHKNRNRERIKSILPEISLITARDRQSYDYIKQLDQNVKIHITADEALTALPCRNGSNIILPQLKNNGFICVSVRKWRSITDESYIKYIGIISDFCKCNNLGVLFIVMEKRNDAAVTEKLKRYMQVPTQILYTGDSMSADELTRIMADAKLTVSVRLHSLIFSACANVPMIGLVYDPKVSSFLRLAEVPDQYIIDIGDECESRLKTALQDLYTNLNSEKARLSLRMEQLRAAAEQNATITAEFMKSKGV